MTAKVEMPLAVPAQQRAEVPAPQVKMDFAEIPVLDLSTFDRPGGKEKLVSQLKEAVENNGFFYLTNFGVSEEEIDRHFALGKQILELPEEEKVKHVADLKAGNYNGYRPKGAIEQFPGLRDNWECYHIFKFLEENKREHPQLVLDHLDEIERFHRHMHDEVAQKVLRLIGRLLELPEDTLVNEHQYDKTGSTFLRYVKYHARQRDINRKYENIYVRGHTDFGSVTFVFSQPIGGLQLHTRDGKWQDVKHIPGSIIVNTADMLHFWTNGYLQSCVHRVVAPPEGQDHLDRFGLIYFLRPNDDMKLKFVDSPLLQRLGITADDETPEMKAKREVRVGEWVPIQTKRNWTPFDQQAQSNKEFQSLFRS